MDKPVEGKASRHSTTEDGTKDVNNNDTVRDILKTTYEIQQRMMFDFPTFSRQILKLDLL